VGLILDTSTLITAERRRHSIATILEQIQAALGESEVGLSAVTIFELAHGIQRAKPEAQRQRRQMFVDELRAVVTVHPLTDEIAERAGVISGREAERGVTLPFADLLIGITALHLGFEVVTENVRHFQMIPGLVVKQLPTAPPSP
jgi:tRNA(fMet)-specific endonuclease VapC